MRAHDDAAPEPLVASSEGGLSIGGVSSITPLPANLPVVVSSKSLSIIDEIHEQHRLAISHARKATEAGRTAIQHAIRCGQLLLEQKERLTHGQFNLWLTINCKFKRSTATRYMRAAKQKATGVAFSSLQSLFPSGRPARGAAAVRPQPTKKIISSTITVVTAKTDTEVTETVDVIEPKVSDVPRLVDKRIDPRTKREALRNHDARPATIETVRIISEAVEAISVLEMAQRDHNLDFHNISAMEAADLAYALGRAVNSIKALQTALSKHSEKKRKDL